EKVKAIEALAEAKAEAELKKKKDAIGDDLGKQLTSEMLTTEEFEAYKTKTEAFMTIAMEHIELTQIVLDALETNINTVVKTSMDALLAQVQSKTEVPAATQAFSEQATEEETQKEKDRLQVEEGQERERKRVLTP
ncbi:hypothetical protein LCGC14_2172290, partial [marine sediment metagenome]